MKEIILTNYDLTKFKFDFIDEKEFLNMQKLNKDLTNLSLYEFKEDQLIILDFWNEQCTHCNEQEFILKALESKYKEDSVSIFKLNVDYDGNHSLAKEFEILALPSILILNIKKKKAFFYTGLTKNEILESFITGFKIENACINCPHSHPEIKYQNKFYCEKKNTYFSNSELC